MQISGQFKDLHDNTIDVLIYKAGDLTVYNIDDYLDENHHFCFSDENPVVITRECNDLFEPIISSSCSIHLQSNIWCGDMLFANGIGDIIVRVKRTVNNVEEVIFVGYVTPLTYSQDVNKQFNEIEINCKDVLGFLEDRTLSTGSTYETVLANAQYRTFTNIFKLLGLGDTSSYSFVFPNEAYTTTLYLDQNVAEYKDLQISDNLWIGTSKDDEMNMKDILLEILKYTNSRIISTNGINHFVISNNNTTSQNTFFNVNANENQTLLVTSSDMPQIDKSNEQVTIDDCFNVIGVRCDLEKVDDVIVSPLEKTKYIKPYTNKQLFMSEYACENEDAVYGSRYYDNWLSMIEQDQPVYYNNITDYSKLWMKHWYIRFCKAQDWELYNEFVPPTDSNGNLIQQYVVGGRMNDLFNRSEKVVYPVDYNVYDYGYKISYDTPFYSYPAFVEVGCSNNKMTAINPDEGEIKMEPHLIIPCPETWRFFKDDDNYVTEEWAYNYINKELAKYETNPLVKYKSPTVVNFTPSNENTTNYLIFSGSLELIPSCLFETQYLPQFNFLERGLSMSDSFQAYIWAMYGIYPYIRPTEDFHYPSRSNVAGPSKGDERWYARMYWTKESPNQETAYHTHSPIDDTEHTISQQLQDQYHTQQEPGSPTYKEGELYSLSTEGMYGKLFGWGNTVIDKRNTTVVNLGYVPVLMCRLRIGDKWLSENMSEGQELPTYTWTTDPTSVFSIGVGPRRPDNLGDEPKDYLIGQKYDIINTVVDRMNLPNGTNGMAIPITYNDKIKGDIEFQIVGPYNAVLTSTNHYYRHSTFFRSTKSWSEQNADICVLNHVHAIDITNFEMKAESDNAKNTTWNEGDLLYYSEDNKKYNNPKDEIDFKIVSGLTPEEAAELNIAVGVSFNNPTDTNGDIYTPDVKPEENYVETMYNLYSTPKKIIEYETKYGDINIADMYRTVYDCDLLTDLDIEDFDSIIIGDEIDLKNDRIKIKTREL